MEPIYDDWRALCVVALLAFLAALALVGGVAEWIVIRKRKQRRPLNKALNFFSLFSLKLFFRSESQVKMQGFQDDLVRGSINDEGDAGHRDNKRPPLCCGLLMAFSPITNFKKLVQPTSVPHLASLNALRVFSMFWVILGTHPPSSPFAYALA